MKDDNAQARRPADEVAVIFDMDGVLIDSAAAHLQSWRRLAEEHGGAVNPDVFVGTFGRQNRDIIPMLFGPVTQSQLRVLADRKEEIYRDLIRECPPIVAGAVELIRALHRSGVPLAVGSSGPKRNIDLILDLTGLAGHFSVIVSGDDVNRGKPDPQVFTLAIRRLGRPPQRCVVVEDAPVGVQAAQAAGARTVAVLRHHAADAFDAPDLVVARLAELSVDKLVSLVQP